jgi:hypothetical protein
MGGKETPGADRGYRPTWAAELGVDIVGTPTLNMGGLHLCARLSHEDANDSQ